METPPHSPVAGTTLFDPSLPLRGVVVCCTSIPPEQRSDISAKTAELGGIHKYDLTPDVTHLIVGEYDTPKYRHVAKERPDIRPMAAGWVEAVRGLWVQDADIDFVALEDEWTLRTLETGGGDLGPSGQQGERTRLLCCLTGFDDPDHRQQIVDTIVANGGAYTGDLTRKVTHLIVHKPEGRKYAAARVWGVQTVSIEWLQDCVQRRMILDEKSYDPILPVEERGKCAWTRKEIKTASLGKRLREGAVSAAQEEGKRKLRKTASMKLNSQRDNLWGDILGKAASAEPAAQSAREPTQSSNSRPQQGACAQLSGRPQDDTQGSRLSTLGPSEEESVFTSCCFYVHGFAAKKRDILANTVSYMGGLLCGSLDDVASNSRAQLAFRFLIVPQDSKPETHPSLSDDIHIVTEFFIEKCLHKKQLFDPSGHIIGQPFPVFPIEGFETLSICTAGFTGVDLNQVDKAIRQLGARYEERFTAQSSLLLCSSLTQVRRQKLDLALRWEVPVVSAEWLWSCITTGFKAPVKDFMYPELKQRLDPGGDSEGKEARERPWTAAEKHQDVKSDGQPTSRGGIRDVDMSAFSNEEVAAGPQAAPATRRPASKEDSDVTTQFETAPSHPAQNLDTTRLSAPLSEAPSHSRNRPPSPQKATHPPRKPRSRVPSEIANSEATDDAFDLDTLPGGDENEIPHGFPNRPAAHGNAAKLVAERLALSAKLTTLLDPTTSAASVTAAAAAAQKPVEPPMSADAAAAATFPPPRRRRGILGRAISNVSAASSESPAEDAAPTQTAPGSTQLEYEDPEARKMRAQMMRKMLGAGVPVAEVAEEQGGGRLTLAEMGGYGAYDAGAGAAVAGTRSSRRRGRGGA